MGGSDAIKMYVQILNGMSKEESRYVTDEESAALWDQISAEIKEISEKHPGAQFEIPNE